MDQQQTEQLRYLFSRYANNLSTKAEYDAFLEFINDAESNAELKLLLSQLWHELEEKQQKPTRSFIYKLLPYGIAASVLLAAGTAYFFLKPNEQQPIKHDVAPFTAAAILKTHGKTIILEKARNGKIESNITKSAGEQLTYTSDHEITPVYDTIQIPAGGRPYTVKLSDGSRITLNAATTLRYPETFSKNRTEQVELISGEIYAEIVHNENAPLTIKAPGQLIEDIGTEFNINAYNDEPDKRTTLVEGSIKVNSTTLKPGQQTINGTLNREAFNLEQTVAWKNGDFNFRGEHIQTIMRQLARWYNIEVIYEGKITNEIFFAQVSRKRNLSFVLRSLEKTKKVKFKIEGRRVTVLSKS